MEIRLAALRERTDLHPSHKALVEHSYLDMMGQYRRELELDEATHTMEEQQSSAPPAGQVN
jgi:hypothetical protein